MNGGVRFRTLCAECNNGLGAKEDKVLIDFAAQIRKLIESPIVLASGRVSTKPNLLYKGLLAHLVSANNNWIPCQFDNQARDLFFARTPLSLSSWSLFYWIYEGDDIFVMRNAYYMVWNPRVEVIPMQIVKLYPLAFMFAQVPWFYGLPNIQSFFAPRDEIECEVPIDLRARDAHPFWPAVPQDRNIVMLAQSSFGLIGRRD